MYNENNDNNQLNSTGPTMTPNPNPNPTPTPVQPQPTVPTAAPEMPQQPVSNPEPAPTRSFADFEMPQQTPPVAQPTMMQQPTMETPTMVETQPQMTETPKKNNNNLIIILAVVVILAVAIAGGFFLFGGTNENEQTPQQPTNNNEEEKAFLALAGKYVDAVAELWESDKMVCQNATNATEMLKPSELSTSDAYGGPAYYYVFINTKDDTEMKLDVDDSTDVAGWVRIGKTDSSYYVALSDGTTYIVDKGTEEGEKFSNLTVKDVFTKGNGNNYQYFNGEIYGSNTDGNGWGIGDSVVLNDDDDTNDGIYMSNGKKTGGYTPFCNNIEG